MHTADVSCNYGIVKLLAARYMYVYGRVQVLRGKHVESGVRR